MDDEETNMPERPLGRNQRALLAGLGGVKMALVVPDKVSNSLVQRGLLVAEPDGSCARITPGGADMDQHVEHMWTIFRGDARDAIEALDRARDGAGFVLAPVEPTQHMRSAGDRAVNPQNPAAAVRPEHYYRAMLAARPRALV